MVGRLNESLKDEIQVIKVGGSILRSMHDFDYTARLIVDYARTSRVIVVVSAMKGTTSELLDIVLNKKDATELVEIGEKYASILDVIGTNEGLEDLARLMKEGEELLKLIKSRTYDPQSTDSLLSLGERMSSVVMREYIRRLGLAAVSLSGGEAGIITDSRFGNANPLIKESLYQIRKTILPLIANDVIVVIAGFTGRTPDGRITTMGRGSSDLTATLIGAALRVSRIRLFTNSKGILTADPKLVRSPQVLRRVNIKEADVMAMFRVKNFHPLTFKPLVAYKGEVIIGPPSRFVEGTIIDRAISPPPLKVITMSDGQIVLIGHGVRLYLQKILKVTKPRNFALNDYYVTLTPRSEENIHDILRSLHSIIVEEMGVPVHGR